MPYLILALLLILPVTELWILIEVGSTMGALPTIALLIALGVSGVWLLQRQGMATWQRAQADIRAGQPPSSAGADAAGLLLAAVLILVPGLISSAVGGLLLVPPLRRGVMRWIARRFTASAIVFDTAGMDRRRGRHTPQGRGPIIEGEYRVDPPHADAPPDGKTIRPSP